MRDFARELAWALRSLGRNPGFTAAAILTLALGIGANTAIFGALEAALLRSLPVAQPQQLYWLRKGDAANPNPRFSFNNFRDFQTALAGNAEILAATPPNGLFMPVPDAPPKILESELVSGNFFSVLGIQPWRGRLLSPADDQAPDGAPVAVLSYAYWKRNYGPGPHAVGSSLTLNSVALAIVGIAPPGFYGLDKSDPTSVWVPLHLQSRLHYADNASSHDDRGPANEKLPWATQPGIAWLNLLARVSSDRAQAGVPALVTAVDQRDLAPYVGRVGISDAKRAALLHERVWLIPGGQGFAYLAEQLSTPLMVLMAMAALVLLIACANVAMLLLARGLARRREIALRLALGARRATVARMMLIESLLLAVAGSGLGLLIAFWSGGALLALLGADMPASAAALDGKVLAFAFALAVVTGILFGLAPVIAARGVALNEALKADAATGAGAKKLWLGHALVVGQVALSLLLLIGAGLFARSLQRLLALNPGFSENVLTMGIAPDVSGVALAELPARYETLLRRLDELPDVESASLALNGVISGSRWTSGFVIPAHGGHVLQTAEIQEDAVSADYLRTLGIPLLRGRNFTRADGPNAPPVVLVNRALAKRFFPGQDPIGATLGYGASHQFRIVGVVGDMRANGVTRAAPPMVIHPLAQSLDYAYFLAVRASGKPTAITSEVRQTIGQVWPGMPVVRMATLRQNIERGLGNERMFAELSTGFALLAVLLAGLGLYGVLAYVVGRRTNEIGIRMALGASRGEIFRLVLGAAARLVALGLCLGIALAIPLLHLLRSLLFGLSPLDPVALAAALAALIAAAFVAATWPARRAMRLDPWRALRRE